MPLHPCQSLHSQQRLLPAPFSAFSVSSMFFQAAVQEMVRVMSTFVQHFAGRPGLCMSVERARSKALDRAHCFFDLKPHLACLSARTRERITQRLVCFGLLSLVAEVGRRGCGCIAAPVCGSWPGRPPERAVFCRFIDLVQDREAAVLEARLRRSFRRTEGMDVSAGTSRARDAES